MKKSEEKLNNDEPQTSVESPFIKQEKSKNIILKWLLIVSVFFISILVSLYFLSSYSLINEIAVEGTNEVYDQNVLESSEVSPGDSLWRTYFNKSEIENRIEEQNKQVSSAHLGFSGINNFVLKIEEYETVAYLTQDNQYKKILENGTILEEVVPRPSTNQPILSGFTEGTALELILREYSHLNEQVKLLISEIEYQDNERNSMLVHVYMNDGNEVLASVPSFSERMNYYPEMVRAVDGEKGLFDLEAGAYFIPYDSEEESEELEESTIIDD